MKNWARTRDNVDFLRKIGENAKPLLYGAREANFFEPLLDQIILHFMKLMESYGVLNT